MKARLKRSGSHTAQATRYVLRRLEAGKTQLEVLDELEERGCSEDRAEALVIGAIVAYDGLFSVDSRLQLEALVASDYAAVQGFVLCMALLFVALNLVIDISYSLIDPRIGFEAR